MSARNRVCNAGIGKVHEFVLSLDKAGFSTGQLQNIIDSEKNRYAKVMYNAFTNARAEDVFEFLNSFEIVVPEKFYHLDMRDLETFFEKYRGDTVENSYISYCLSNFYNHECESRLTRGKKFDVKIFQTKHATVPEDCMSLLRSQKAIPVGHAGLMLAFNQHKSDFPAGKWLFSLNEEQVFYAFNHNRLPRPLRICHNIPALNDEFEHQSLDVSEFCDNDCILCFCPK